MIERIKKDPRQSFEVEALLHAHSSQDVESKAQLERVARHIAYFIDCLAAAYTVAVGDAVSLSVKFLWRSQGAQQPTLHTLYRSTNTRDIRAAYAPPNDHSLFENSAFDDIMKKWPAVQEYAADDLFSKWLSGEYANSNDFWSNFYNSTAVVSIPQSKAGSALPVGFLCADSLKGRLAKHDVVSTLRDAACHLYDVLGVLLDKEAHPGVALVLGEPTALHLPCGWIYNDGVLTARDEHCQKHFEQTLTAIQHFLPTGQRGPGSETSGRYARHASEDPMSDEDEFVPGYDDLAYETLSPVVKRPKKTDAEIDVILERMAQYNPDAAQALARRR